MPNWCPWSCPSLHPNVVGGNSRTLGSHALERTWRSWLDAPPANNCLCSYERTSAEHSACWPSAGTSFKAENEKGPASEVDSFDAFLDEKEKMAPAVKATQLLGEVT